MMKMKKKSNENDESKINKREKETVTLDDPITNETKAVPVVIIDYDIKSNKKFKNGYSWGRFSSRKCDKIFSR